MKQVLKFTMIGLLVVGLLGITAVGVAYAQGDPPQPLETIADLLGLTTDELQVQLKDGKTLNELAIDAGIELVDLQKAIRETRLENFKSRIQIALNDDEITQDHADWITEGLEKGFMGGGNDFGGRGRMGHFTDGERPKPFDGRLDVECKERPGSWNRLPWFNQ